MGKRALALEYLDLVSLFGYRTWYLLKGIVLTCARIYLNSHGLGTILSWEVKVCVECNLSIGCTLCDELAFSLTASGDIISWYHLKRILVVPVGCGVPI